jgi:hypothetical protein
MPISNAELPRMSPQRNRAPIVWELHWPALCVCVPASARHSLALRMLEGCYQLQQLTQLFIGCPTTRNLSSGPMQCLHSGATTRSAMYSSLQYAEQPQLRLTTPANLYTAGHPYSHKILRSKHQTLPSQPSGRQEGCLMVSCAGSP